METYTLSKELTIVFEYIKNDINQEYPNSIVNELTFILSVLSIRKSAAYQVLASVVDDKELSQAKHFAHLKMADIKKETKKEGKDYSLFDDYILDCGSIAKKYSLKSITSSMLLLTIINKDKKSREFFETYISTEIDTIINAIEKKLSQSKQKQKKVRNKYPLVPNDTQNVEPVYDEEEISLKNISYLSSKGKIPTVINYEKYYTKIFTILSKKYKNAVIICGNHGVGKTATAKYLATLINERKCAKKLFGKEIIDLDFTKLSIGTSYRGSFEEKIHAIVKGAKSVGNCIFLIDNVHVLFNGKTKYAETDIEEIFSIMLREPSIRIVCTSTIEGYNDIHKTSVGKYFEKVVIDDPSIEDSIPIIQMYKKEFENFHNVTYTDDSIKACAEYCKKYIKSCSLPESALNILDTVGASVSSEVKLNPKIIELKKELESVAYKIAELKNTAKSKEYEKIDTLIKEQILLRSQINILKKEDNLSKKPLLIRREDVVSIVSEKVGIPLEKLNISEKEKLKGLNEKIKESVIGQDKAIDDICRAVKRHRVRLGDPIRPNVLMFLGSTGCGKTLLAKEIAKEVYGNEKKLIRLDMAEYSDKTAVNKITGSSMGYVGYEDKTVLEKALDKWNDFVLLLDEFEKADEQVQNVFLGIFDEGRFTDNHAKEYDLKNITIIITSNVGAQEAALRGKRIGFDNVNSDISSEIIKKELKKKFKPELLNRIQSIAYFNKLSDDNIKSIIDIEIRKIEKRVNENGYTFNTDVYELSETIFNMISKEQEYGARPIVNAVERVIGDKVVDMIIENDLPPNYEFKKADFVS